VRNFSDSQKLSQEKTQRKTKCRPLHISQETAFHNDFIMLLNQKFVTSFRPHPVREGMAFTLWPIFLELLAVEQTWGSSVSSLARTYRT
jgi:hypothetical protein